jgi:hypothetical protein
MTNFTSFAGAATWMAISALLTLAALEPVKIAAPAAPASVQAA